MEIVIVVCLLMVIILLVSEKIVIKKIIYRKEETLPPESDLPEIMGRPKPVERRLKSKSATESQIKEQGINRNNLANDNGKNKIAKVQVPPEELDEVFGSLPDLDEEEEEWAMSGAPNGEDGFATGVTFGELSTVGTLLRQEVPDTALQKQAVDIVRRMQGTELFSLLESSMENASQKIAQLLDNSLNTKIDSVSSGLRKTDPGDFDIGEFV